MTRTGYKTVVGTGGIGSGIIYRLEGRHDLGRNESRLARRVDQQDFCKLHIILHYVAVLCRDLGLKLAIFPVGAVGNDSTGKDLLAQMRHVGMQLKYVRVMDRARTLFSVCYQFPDGSGGNLTELNSASGKVSPAMIRAAQGELCQRSLALAAPEVPFATRLLLLRLAKQQQSFTAASFTSHEMSVVRRGKLLKLVDLLSINIDEAAALAEVPSRKSSRQIVAACAIYIRNVSPHTKVCITDGADGVYGLSGNEIEYRPALKVKVANTAGAGDAALAGQIVGVLTGQPWRSCFQLGRLLSAMSVTSPDTIHFGINLKSLRAFAAAHGQKLG